MPSDYVPLGVVAALQQPYHSRAKLTFEVFEVNQNLLLLLSPHMPENLDG